MNDGGGVNVTGNVDVTRKVVGVETSARETLIPQLETSSALNSRRYFTFTLGL